MVHNGIEYADMQLIAEAYDLLRHGVGLRRRRDRATSSREWNTGDLDSFLIEITAEVLGKTDAATGKPLVDVIARRGRAEGHRRWTVQTALDLGVPVTGIAEAVFARSLSGHADQRAAAPAVLAGPTPGDALRGRRRRSSTTSAQALYASKIVAYAQGFEQIAAGRDEYDWDIDLGAIATIWRGGCIIRARFLDRIREAYDDEPGPGQPAARRRTSRDAVADGPGRLAPGDRRRGRAAASRCPAFSSSLAYYDGSARERLPGRR